ncbi:hypothetical protein GCM10012279_57480 [Micromonospora yangpuensis]|nr:hypothetical protein GCM10012279_57480 [Micromonospora yangpuensis]
MLGELRLPVVQVADGSGGAKLEGQGFHAEGAGPAGFALLGRDAGKQGEVEDSAMYLAAVHAQGSNALQHLEQLPNHPVL